MRQIDRPPPKVDGEAEANEWFVKAQRRAAFLYLGRLLTHRDMLEKQLRSRLKERGVSIECIDEVICRCSEMGWIDDRRWIDGYVRGQERRLKSPMAIRCKLIQKGAPRALIEERLLSLNGEEEQRRLITELLDRRYRGKERHKVYQALVRRGFNPGVVRSCLEW